MERPVFHPGEILREEFLKPLGISAKKLSQAIRIPLKRINGILAGRIGLCIDTAMRLSHYFGTSDRFWLEIQLAYDMERARARRGAIRNQIVPLQAAV